MRHALIKRANLERNESMGFRDLLGKELLFFDGATGTMLQALGLQPGELPELWNFTHAAEVQSVHEAYLNNGSKYHKKQYLRGEPS